MSFKINAVTDKKQINYFRFLFLIDGWVNYIAVDGDGYLYFYENKPESVIKNKFFKVNSGIERLICKVGFEGDWRDSLVYVGDKS